MQLTSRNKKYLNLTRLYSTSHGAMQHRRQTTLPRSCPCAPSFKCTVFINIALVALTFTRSCNAVSCANQRQYFILVHRNAELLEQRVLSQKIYHRKPKLSSCLLMYRNQIARNWKRVRSKDCRNQCTLLWRPGVMLILRFDYTFANCEMYLRMLRTIFKIT